MNTNHHWKSTGVLFIHCNFMSVSQNLTVTKDYITNKVETFHKKKKTSSVSIIIIIKYFAEEKNALLFDVCMIVIYQLTPCFWQTRIYYLPAVNSVSFIHSCVFVHQWFHLMDTRYKVTLIDLLVQVNSSCRCPHSGDKRDRKWCWSLGIERKSIQCALFG